MTPAQHAGELTGGELSAPVQTDKQQVAVVLRENPARPDHVIHGALEEDERALLPFRHVVAV